MKKDVDSLKQKEQIREESPARSNGSSHEDDEASSHSSRDERHTGRRESSRRRASLSSTRSSEPRSRSRANRSPRNSSRSCSRGGASDARRPTKRLWADRMSDSEESLQISLPLINPRVQKSMISSARSRRGPGSFSPRLVPGGYPTSLEEKSGVHFHSLRSLPPELLS